MTKYENKIPVNCTTDEQAAAPDFFDKIGSWVGTRLNRLIDNVIDDPVPVLQFLLIDRDNRRTQKNVRRVIERRQEIELMSERLYLRTGIPQDCSDKSQRLLNERVCHQEELPEETEQD